MSGGCVGPLAESATSVPIGHHACGALVRGVPLPFEGTGYSIPEAWRGRAAHFTTERIAGWLSRAFVRFSERYPDAIAAVGDLSPRGGGEVSRHKSHESGRDVDIFFFGSDAMGRVFRSEEAMLRFASDGDAAGWSPPRPDERITDPVPDVRFDAARNWGVVRALLEDDSVELQRIFVHRALAEMMLGEAEREGESPELVARAAALFHQPADAQPHDDHMHVRVACAAWEKACGCLDQPPPGFFLAKRHRRKPVHRMFVAAKAGRSPIAARTAAIHAKSRLR